VTIRQKAEVAADLCETPTRKPDVGRHLPTPNKRKHRRFRDSIVSGQPAMTARGTIARALCRAIDQCVEQSRDYPINQSCSD
jgi:hypothetical protein